MTEYSQTLDNSIPSIHKPNYNGFYSILVLHSKRNGVFREVVIDKDFEHRYVVEKELRVVEGDYVSAFTGASNAVGTLFLRFKQREEMEEVLNNQDKYLKVIVK